MITWTAAMRWSQSARAWCGLFATLPDGRALLRQELRWHRLTPEQAADDFHAQLSRWKIARVSSVIAQPAIFPKSNEHTETVSEIFARQKLPMRRGHDNREAGWSRLRSWLQVREWIMRDGDEVRKLSSPSLLIHPECASVIRTLPTLVSHPTKPDDIDETPDEYPAMGCALFVMSRPFPPKAPEPTSQPGTWGELVEELRRELEYA